MRRFLLSLLLSVVLVTLPRPGSQVAAIGLPPKALDSGAGHPQLIMIIRHGEKPEEPENGKKKKEADPNLSPRGYERAKALAHVIPDHFARPDYLFATQRSKHSLRPIETITPLAGALHENIDEKYADDDYAALAHKILDDSKYAGHVVLISWHHGKIPELAHALGATEAPEKWSGKVFDRVWEITWENGKTAFADLPQKALSGDSDK